MPPIRNTKELKEAARSRNFLNKTSPQYQTVNRFNQKLMDLQDKLKNDGETELRSKVASLSKNLMTLQLHDSPMVKGADLSNAITDVTVDLPYSLKAPANGAGGKTGYEALVEAGAKYGVFTKQELDEAMTLVGQGMGVSMGVDAPEKAQKEAEEEAKQAQAQLEQEQAQEELLAEQQVIIDAQANIALLDNEEEQKEEEKKEEQEKKPYTDRWLKQQKEQIGKKQTAYRKAGPLPALEQIKDKHFLESSAGQACYHLNALGAYDSDKQEPYPPEQNGVPSVFLVQNGQVKTLQEAGMWLWKDDGTSRKPNPEFAKAILRGEVFAYPAGSRYPVQLQGKVEKDAATFMDVSHSNPLKGSDKVTKIEIAPEPALARAPRWYHRAFKFWGKNREICERYDASVTARENWKAAAEKLVNEQTKAMPASNQVADAIEAKFGALRTKEARQEEMKLASQAYEQKLQNGRNALLNDAKGKATKVAVGISIVENVFAAKPEPRQEWVMDKEMYAEQSKGLYTLKSFSRLTKADIDPSTVKIGEKPVSEREFAALAMFGSLEPKLGVLAQKDAVKDPAPMIKGLVADGYTQEQAEQLIMKSISNAYTVDVLHKEDRMRFYFNTVNGGRKNAEEALKAYPQDKTKLAGILADGIGQAAEMAGVTGAMSQEGDYGVNGFVKLSGEMIDLMERDPELKELTKQSLEQKERDFRKMVNEKVAPFTKDGKPPLKPRTLEECIQSVRAYEKFSEIEQKGYEATQALAQASADGKKDLPEAEKKGYIKDILKASMVSELYRKQRADRISSNEGVGVNKGIIALNNYTADMTRRIEEAEEAELGDNVVNGGGSSLPGNAPTIIMTGLQNRLAEKAPVVAMVNKPERLEELDRQAEQIMEQDGLDKMSPEELCNTFSHGATKESPYWGDNMVLRTAKLSQPQEQREAEQLQQELEQQVEQAGDLGVQYL